MAMDTAVQPGQTIRVKLNPGITRAHIGRALHQAVDGITYSQVGNNDRIDGILESVAADGGYGTMRLLVTGMTMQIHSGETMTDADRDNGVIGAGGGTVKAVTPDTTGVSGRIHDFDHTAKTAVVEPRT